MSRMPIKRVVLQTCVVGVILGLGIGALTHPVTVDAARETSAPSREAPLAPAAPAASARQAAIPSGAVAEAETATSAALPAAPAEKRAARPAPRPVEAAAEPVARTLTVGRGDTLSAVLRRANVPAEDVQATIEALRPVFNPRHLRAGQKLVLDFEPLGNGTEPRLALRRLSLPVEFDRDVVVDRTEIGFTGREIVKEFDSRLARMGATISTSLFGAAGLAGVPRQVLFDLIRLYSFDVDFQRDLHPGDNFEVVFERLYDEEGNHVAEGAITYAVLTLSGKRHQLFRHVRPDGRPGYFDEDGESAEKALMRTPIDGARLSSRYGPRKHPILGYTRMHRGLDFAAPRGTPIMAAGSGVIEKAGRNKGYGNYVRIRHNSEYSTAYAHLSRFARGIRAGSRVEQGQVIGYVGTTGLSTGPHLHYEVLSNGRQVNPFALRMPTVKKLEGPELEAFQTRVAAVELQIQGLPLETQIASR